MTHPMTRIQAKGKPAWLSIDNLPSLQERGAHVLVPATYAETPSKFFGSSITVVFIDPDPAKKEVWQLPGATAKFGLTKTGLMKICRAAGIEFVGARCVDRREGYVRYLAAVRQRDESGLYETFKGTKTMDRALLFEEALRGARKKMSEDAAMKKADEDTFRIWRFHEERAETGAYLRAIRSMMLLRGDFTAQELTKPFVVRAVRFAPDLADPTVREMVTNSRALTLAMFGEADAIAALEERTGKTHAQLVADQKAVRAIQDGNREEGRLALEAGEPAFEEETLDLADAPEMPLLDDAPIYDDEEV